MKQLLAYVQILSASAVICSASAATTYTWKYRDGVGTSPESMASWSDSENWASGVASGSDAYADFNTNINKDSNNA